MRQQLECRPQPFFVIFALVERERETERERERQREREIKRKREREREREREGGSMTRMRALLVS